MKRYLSIFSTLIVLGLIVFFQSCSMDACHEKVKYNVYEPVYKTKEQLRQVNVESPRDLKKPGKIYVYKNYLFINELYEGVHVFDNRNPASPKALYFISISGNVDIAIRNDVLYADNYFDIMSFDISDINNIKYMGSVEDVFNDKAHFRKGKGYLIYYRLTDKIEERDCSDVPPNVWTEYYDGNKRGGGDVLYNGTSSGPTPPVIGTGGSMARFSIAGDRFYCIDNLNLKVFGFTFQNELTFKNNVYIGSGIETLFRYGKYLFVGANNGMYIYDASDPDNPKFKSQFKHARSCDPVFVKGKYAFVTLRSGTKCRGYTNQLDVVEISDPVNPVLIKTYPMQNPHGLSIINDKMILCEGDYGAKVLDVAKVIDIKVKSKISNIHAYDVIAINENDILIVGDDGLYQYELNDYDLDEISLIPIIKE